METGNPAYITRRGIWYHWNLIAEVASGRKNKHTITTSAHTLVVSYAGGEIRDSCFRSTLVMKAGKEERRGVVRFWTAEGIEEREIIVASHVCCLRLTQHVMFACIGVAQETRRGLQFRDLVGKRFNIAHMAQISPHAIFTFLES